MKAQENYYDDPLTFFEYELFRTIGISLYEEDSVMMRGMIGDLSNKRVLDFGCGFGILTAKMADFAKTVLGVDISSRQLKHARANFARDNLKYRRVAVNNGLEKIRNKFDIVVSHSVLHYLPDLESTFTHFNRLLDKDGNVVVNMPHPETIANENYASGERVQTSGRINYYRPAEEIESAFSKTGFRVTDIATGGTVQRFGQSDCPRLLMMKAEKMN